MTKHILIADDSSFLRENLRLMIERHPGWEVCEAGDGAEAVRKSQQLAPDAVVLDPSQCRRWMGWQPGAG
jgi:chemotaxis response regulator CheB